MRKRILIGVAGGIAVAGVLISGRMTSGAESASAAGSGPARQPRPAVAATAATAPATQPSQLTLPGILVPDELVDVFAKASGYVSKITVDYGSRVRRGGRPDRTGRSELTDECTRRRQRLLLDKRECFADRQGE